MLIGLLLALCLPTSAMAFDEARARKLSRALRHAFERRGLTMLGVSQEAQRHQAVVTRQVDCGEGLGYTLASQDNEVLGELAVQLGLAFGIPRAYRIGQKLREVRGRKRMARMGAPVEKARIA